MTYQKEKNALPKGTILKHGSTQYLIKETLGAGGFGITYLVSAKVRIAGQEVQVSRTVKEFFLSQDCERDATTLRITCSNPAKDRVEAGKKDFLAEARRLQKEIDHSHIVKVTDVFESNDTAYYVMEFLDGMNLNKYVRNYGACKENEAIELLFPIACAVGYLHSEHTTHLDIKPDNIMIVNKPGGKLSPVLIDFGLSKHYDKKGRPTSSIRTMAVSGGYAPQEQYLGITEFQPTADIYALAATFAFCITGREPRLASAIRPGELRQELEKLLSPNALEAILKGMEQSRFDRTQTVRDFLSALCPDRKIDSWDIETDDNVTAPLFFQRKKKQTLSARLKSLFSPSNKSLKIPDKGIFIGIYVPASWGLTKRVLLNVGTKSTVTTSTTTPRGSKELSKKQFKVDMLPKDVIACLKNYKVFEADKWRSDDNVPTATLDNGSVYIELKYADGTILRQSETDISQPATSPLFTAIGELLRCESIRDFIYGSDEALMQQLKSDYFSEYICGGIFTMSIHGSQHIATIYQHLTPAWPGPAERIFFEEKQLQGALQEELGKLRLQSFIADEETPMNYFWNSLEPYNTLLLESNDTEYVHALALQYRLRLSQNIFSKTHQSFRISHPAVLNAFWRSIENNLYEEMGSYCYGSDYQCLCSYNKGFCGIYSVTNNVSDTHFPPDVEGMVKGAIIINGIINKYGYAYADFLLSDVIEYDVMLVAVTNGHDSQYYPIVNRNSSIPLKISEEIPSDVINSSEMYIQIGKERILLNDTLISEKIMGNDNVSFIVEIDCDRTMNLSIQAGSYQKSISVGEIISVFNKS